MQSIFNDDVESSLKDHSLAFVNNQLEIALKTCETSTDNLFGVSNKMIENFSFQAGKAGGLPSQNFYFTAFNVRK